MYIRPPAKKNRASSGVTSGSKDPTHDSRIVENKSSMKSSPRGEIGLLMVRPFDSAPSA